MYDALDSLNDTKRHPTGRFQCGSCWQHWDGGKLKRGLPGENAWVCGDIQCGGTVTKVQSSAAAIF